MARVNELPGDRMSSMEGKLPAGGRGATVRGDGVSHSRQGLRGCHVRTARNCATHACQGWCAAEGFVWSLQEPINMPPGKAASGSLLGESPMIA